MDASNPASFREPLALAYQQALRHLESLKDQPVNASTPLTELRRKLGRSLDEDSIAAEEVVRDLIHDTEGGLLRCPGGRFFAWAIGGSVPAALAADWLTATWDQNAALYACSPAAAVVEEIAGAWLKDVLGIPSGASFAFVTGCQMAHVTCLAAARNSLLSDRGWNVERKGLCGAPAIRVLTSNRHGSVDRAIRLLGIGEDNLVDLPLDAQAHTTVADLEEALRHSRGAATIVILQAGDLNSGSFDDYAALIPVAKRYNAWVHIDGAFGLWAGASPCYRHLLRGVEQADSWATDGHKWLNVPYDCGYAFVAKPDAHAAALSYRAPYLIHDLDARDQIDWNPEWSRRARAFPTYAALRQLGRKGIAAIVDTCCERARELAQGIAALDGAQLVWPPTINQALIRFLDPAPGATEEDHDRFTDTVIGRVVQGGEAFFLGTAWRGRRAMRISVLNWQTSQYDVERAIASVRKCLGAVQQEGKKA